MKHNEYVAKQLKETPAVDYWYCATPYTKVPEGYEYAMENATAVGAWAVEHGINVFVPIAHSHPISLKVNPELNTHKTWMAQDKPMVFHAIGLIIAKIPGWQDSKGIAMEIAWAKEQGKPVYYLEWPLNGE